jgi:hypothetical protein
MGKKGCQQDLEEPSAGFLDLIGRVNVFFVNDVVGDNEVKATTG